MRKIPSLLLCLLLLAPLAAEPLADTGTLSSTNASYDGNALLLSGHVVLDHGLGKMTSEEASLQRQEAGKDFPFALIQLRKDVKLALKNSAEITCASADLDFTALKGILLPVENGKVVYTDQIKKKKENVPLQLLGKQVELNFSKLAHDGKKTEYEVESVLAKEDVLIEYAQNFHLFADHALYRKQLPLDVKTPLKEFQGIVTAYPKDEKSTCRLTHDADVIDAAMIDLDLLHSSLTLLRPVGTFSSIQFHAEHLHWDRIKELLTLKGNIHIDEKTLGVLDAKEQIQIAHKTEEGKQLLKSLHSEGPASLVYKDAGGLSHKLLTSGPIHIDKERLIATVQGAPKEQLYYEEAELAVYADHASLEYALSGENLEPTSLTLKGGVRLFSHDAEKPPRRALADKLSYSLSTRTLILSANPGNKVLFSDASKQMRLSAPEVHITFDPESKQQQVKGVGKVQLTFTPDEESKFQKLFPTIAHE
ncbi:MAG: hypothetical protein JSS61_01920 [Verrucomicrobia bacterium]|nr:hypothetical protein [Verrucomicrobiota bacterium]